MSRSSSAGVISVNHGITFLFIKLCDGPIGSCSLCENKFINCFVRKSNIVIDSTYIMPGRKPTWRKIHCTHFKLWDVFWGTEIVWTCSPACLFLKAFNQLLIQIQGGIGKISLNVGVNEYMSNPVPMRTHSQSCEIKCQVDTREGFYHVCPPRHMD